MGIQTYIENNCKQPHLYTLLSAWNQFISCGMHEQCGNEEINCKVCSVTYKDTIATDVTHLSSSFEPSPEAVFTGDSPTSTSHLEPVTIETTEHTTLITMVPAETTTEEIEGTATTMGAVSSDTESTVTTSTTVMPTLTSVSTPPRVVYMIPTNQTTISPNTTTVVVTTSTTTTTTTTTELTTTLASTTEFKKHWPSEKSPSSNIKKLDEAEEQKRQPKVEAQQQIEIKKVTQPKPASSATVHRMNLFRIFFAFLIFACNI